jgi:hypothetical protein
MSALTTPNRVLVAGDFAARSRAAPYLTPPGCESFYLEVVTEAPVPEGEILAALGMRARDQLVHVYRSNWHEYTYPVETLETRGAVESVSRVFAEEVGHHRQRALRSLV